MKTSVLTKGLSRHRRYKSSQGLKESSRHARTSSLGNNIMTQSNQYGLNKGYAKLSDQTFKSGDFSKMKTEMEDFDIMEPSQTKPGHRRKTSQIKKVS